MFKCSLLTFILLINVYTKDIDQMEEIIFGSDLKYHIKMNECSEKTCPSPNSFCVSSRICQCSKKYAMVGEIVCGYERKIQLYAFLLETVFTFGVGHLYSQRFEHACFKITIELLLICLYFYYRFSGSDFKFSSETCWDCFISIFYIGLTLSFMVLHMYDIFMFSMNMYKDGTGVSLLSWNDKSE
jgi:hypothetical protein